MRFGRWAAAIALSAAWIGLTAGGATGHSALRESTPADGDVLETPPARIELSFTEPPDVALTTVGVVSSTGAPVSTGPPERVGSGGTIVVPIEGALADGVYTVTWRTVSTVDAHVTASVFTFGVGVEPGVSPDRGRGAVESPAPSVLSVAGRTSLYAGLAVLLAAGLGGLLAFGTGAVARRWLLAAAWLVAAVGVVAMTLAERASVGVPLGILLRSDSGGAFVRLAVAVGVLGVVTLLAALRTSRPTLMILAAAAGATMFVRAEGGHAGGSPLQVVLQWLHLVGVGVWIGGLVWLVVAMRRGLEPARVRRFSNLAAGGLAVLALSGVIRASNELGFTWWLDPLRNGYSTSLAIKVLVAVVLVALGAANRVRNVPRLERRGPRPLLRTVGGELVLAAGVLGITGVMTGLPPTPLGGSEPVGQRTVVATGSDFATTTTVRLEVDPGTVGSNRFVADVTDYDTGEHVLAERVSLTFELQGRPEISSTLPLEPSEHGPWSARGTNLAMNGTWDVTALVETGDASVEVPIAITPRAPEQRIEISRQPGQPDLTTITVQEGLQVQAYVDPGEAGRVNQLHVTAFYPSGDELPLRAGAVTLTSPDGAATTPDLLRFGPGHFAANVELTAGSWTIAITAEARDGRTLVATFDQSFEGVGAWERT